MKAGRLIRSAMAALVAVLVLPASALAEAPGNEGGTVNVGPVSKGPVVSQGSAGYGPETASVPPHLRSRPGQARLPLLRATFIDQFPATPFQVPVQLRTTAWSATPARASLHPRVLPLRRATTYMTRTAVRSVWFVFLTRPTVSCHRPRQRSRWLIRPARGSHGRLSSLVSTQPLG